MKCSYCGSPHPHMHREGCPRLNLANWPELREKTVHRLNAMAGLDERGGILPPTAEDLAAGIDRRPNPWWTNRTGG